MSRGLVSSKRIIEGRRFGEKAVLVQQAAGERRHGEFVEGDPVEKKIRLASAPLTVQSLMTMRELLPEGIHLQQTRKFWLVTPKAGFVRPIRVGNGQTTGDIIKYRGTSYRVIFVPADYSEEGFVEVIGVRPDNDTDLKQ